MPTTVLMKSRNVTWQEALDRLDFLTGNMKDGHLDPASLLQQLKFEALKMYGVMGAIIDKEYNAMAGPVAMGADSVVNYNTLETGGLMIKRVKGLSYKTIDDDDMQLYVEDYSYEEILKKKLNKSETLPKGRYYYTLDGEGKIAVFQGNDIKATETGLNFYVNVTRNIVVDYSDLSKKVDLPDFSISYWLGNSASILLKQKGAEVPGFVSEEKDTGLAAISAAQAAYLKESRISGEDS